MNKLQWLIIFLALFMGLCVGLGSAVECNADLSQGGDSCTVSSSLGGYYE